MAEKIRFQLNLSQDEFLLHYQGRASSLSVLAEDGRRLQLPANNFRRFVTASGLRGRFEIELDHNNRLLRLVRLGKLA